MAQKTIVTVNLVDDIDGSSAAETIQFGFDGRQYEIDLSKRNAKSLRAAVSPYVECAREVRAQRGKRRSMPQRRVVETGVSSRAVREWAVAQGIAVPSRGRIPNVVVEAFKAAGN